MTLTVREPTLIIYLAATGFMIYTVYCAMKIFFDQPPVNRRRTLLCYALYWLVVSTVYLLFNRAPLTLRGNSVAHFKYMRRWQF